MIIETIKKYLLLISGFIALILGIIGIFIPVLPTTPFLLLSAICFIRSSKRLYNWLIHHKILGAYIYHYMTYRAVKKSAKIGALLFLWISLSISIMIVQNIYVRILLVLIGILVSIHIIMLKTLDPKAYEDFKKQPSSPE